MSIIKKFTKKGERTTYSRKGEFYEVESTYGLGGAPPKDKWDKVLGDIDEFRNKPRRLFDTLLTMIEAERDNDPKINLGNRKEYWDYLVEGCEMWLSAVENGLYGEVINLSVPLTKEGKRLKKEHEEEMALYAALEEESIIP